MQDLLLLVIPAVLLCAILATPFKTRVLRPRSEPHRLVLLPLTDCEQLEQRLLYERERAKQDHHTTLFLYHENSDREAAEIATRFCRDEPNLFCGGAELLRRHIADDAVYKVIEIVLY